MIPADRSLENGCPDYQILSLTQDLSLSTYFLTISLLDQKIFHLKVSVSEIVFFGMALRYTNPRALSIVLENFFVYVDISEYSS